AGIKSAIQGSNVPNPDEAVPSFVSGAMAKAGKGLLEGTLQAGTSAVSDKLLDLVGLGGKSAADKGKDTRDYLAPKATSSTLYFDSLTVNAGNGGFLHCIQMDTSVNAANQVVSVGADIAFDADPKFFACLVRFESSSVPTTLPTAY